MHPPQAELGVPARSGVSRIAAGRRGAFTLIELLVVLGIIGILIGLLSAAVQKVRAAAVRARCANNLRQIALALHHFHDVNRFLPPGVRDEKSQDPYPFLSWNARILPYLEQGPLWERTRRAFALDGNFLHDPPHVGLSTVLPVYLCPADAREYHTGNRVPGLRMAFTAFLGVEGTDQFARDGILFLNSQTRLADITDGTSNTLLVGERPPSADGVLGWWYAGWGQSKDGSGDMVLGVREQNIFINGRGCLPGPYHFRPGKIDNQCDAFHFWSLHPGGAHFLFADGSVRFLVYDADPLMPALATRAGGEVVEIP